MRRRRAVMLLAALVAIAPTRGDVTVKAPARVVLVIHGGAGTMPRSRMTPEREKAIRAALEEALHAGHRVLRKEDGTSLDAVEAAVKVMEDSPLFNAGKGAVFTHDGTHELDAAIMDGATRRAGAVAAITVSKNPIAAARAVMDHSPHVLLAGPGADRFARERKLEIVPNSYFDTDRRREELEKARAKEVEPKPTGTVGAVARDRRGHLAAATSTGGMTNKRFGRVGDTPLIGAGTYADDATCAVSCTGHGEHFIRFVAAHDVAALVGYKGLSVAEAAAAVVHGKLHPAGGEGGLIAIDARGNFAAPFNSEGMYRGWITEDGAVHTAIFPE